MNAVEYMKLLLEGVAKAYPQSVYPDVADVLAQDEDGRVCLVFEDQIVSGSPGNFVMNDTYLVDSSFVVVEYRAGSKAFGPKDWTVRTVSTIYSTTPEFSH